VTKQSALLGFTLIELMVALGIVALLLVLGMPSFTTFMRNSEIRSTAESIINGLRTAKAQAASLNTQVTFQFPTAGSADWTMWYLKEDGTRQTIQSFSKSETGKYAVVTMTPAAQQQVIFDGLGRIVNAGTTPPDHIQMIDVASSGSGEGRPLRIIVDDPNPPSPTKPRGMRMCDPDPALLSVTPPDPRAC